jgi:hypothetical protein
VSEERVVDAPWDTNDPSDPMSSYPHSYQDQDHAHEHEDHQDYNRDDPNDERHSFDNIIWIKETAVADSAVEN